MTTAASKPPSPVSLTTFAACSIASPVSSNASSISSFVDGEGSFVDGDGSLAATVGQDDIVGCVDKGTGVSLPTTRSCGNVARL